MLPTHASGIALPASAGPAADDGSTARSWHFALRFVMRAVPALLVALVILLAWHLVVTALNVPQVVLPSPLAVWATFVRTFRFLMTHAVPTTLEAIAGFVLAGIGGIGLATLLASSAHVRNALYPSILFFQLIPKIALAPLFIVWFGIGSTSRLSFIVFISFFPTVLATLAGLLSTPPEMLRLCRACSARGRDIYFHVRIPYAVPMIFSGLKISVTFAIIGVVVGEFITAQAGLGYLILFASSQADTPLALASIAVLCIVGLTLYGIVAGAESLVLARLGEKRLS